MNPPSSQLRQQTTEQVTSGQAHISQSETVREFATPEELLRHDRAQTEVPAAVTERLERSLAAEPPTETKPWWKRLL